MKVAIIGRTEPLLRSAERIAERGHEVPIVVTCEAEPHYQANVDDFRQLSESLGAEFIKTSNINKPSVVSALQESNCEVAASINWKTIIRREVLDTFNHGIINCHAGDLPKYRGNAATNWALIEGEEEIVYSLHYMAEELDAGPVLLKRSMNVTPETRIADVYEFGEENVPQMFGEAIDKIENGEIEINPQSDDRDEILRCYPRCPRDSKIIWSKSAEYLDRIVKASSEPLFGAYTYLGTKKLRIWRTHVESPPTPHLGAPGQVAERRPQEGQVAVITGDGFLVLEEVELEGEGRRRATEVLKSNRDRLGMDVQGEIRKLEQKIEEIER